MEKHLELFNFYMTPYALFPHCLMLGQLVKFKLVLVHRVTLLQAARCSQKIEVQAVGI